MKEARDGGPLVVDTASGLGVRDWEIDVDEDGTALPDTGGMSVSPGAIDNLPFMFRPREHGGTGTNPVWCIEMDDLGPDLEYRADPRDPRGHGFVEPARPMDLQEYREALWETRPRWRKTV
jgi:hypothetical protein